MNSQNRELIEKVCADVLFNRRWYDSDVLTILNYVHDQQATQVHSHKNGFLTLSYCGRCSTIVGEGDRYCSYCGRELKWNVRS